MEPPWRGRPHTRHGRRQRPRPAPRSRASVWRSALKRNVVPEMPGRIRSARWGLVPACDRLRTPVLAHETDHAYSRRRDDDAGFARSGCSANHGGLHRRRMARSKAAILAGGLRCGARGDPDAGTVRGRATRQSRRCAAARPDIGLLTARACRLLPRVRHLGYVTGKRAGADCQPWNRTRSGRDPALSTVAGASTGPVWPCVTPPSGTCMARRVIPSGGVSRVRATVAADAGTGQHTSVGHHRAPAHLGPPRRRSTRLRRGRDPARSGAEGCCIGGEGRFTRCLLPPDVAAQVVVHRWTVSLTGEL